MTDDTPLEAADLLIPVYLDTSALLDLLATIEDSVTLVERVTSGQLQVRPVSAHTPSGTGRD